MRLGAGVVLGACILAAAAGRLPASPQSGDPVPLDADYLEAAAFMDDSRQAVRQADIDRLLAACDGENRLRDRAVILLLLVWG
jgi:hypothetical protein